MVRGSAKERQFCDRFSGPDFYTRPGATWPGEVQGSTVMVEVTDMRNGSKENCQSVETGCRVLGDILVNKGAHSPKYQSPEEELEWEMMNSALRYVEFAGPAGDGSGGTV